MKLIKPLIICICLMILTGCNTLGDQGNPVVDPYGDLNAARIDQDLYECRELAQQASGGSTLKDTAIGAGVGGLVGAAAEPLLAQRPEIRPPVPLPVDLAAVPDKVLAPNIPSNRPTQTV